MTQPQPPQPWQPPHVPPQPPPQVIVSHQMVETRRHGLTGAHAALIIAAVVIGAPLLICLICSLGGAIGAGTSGGTP